MILMLFRMEERIFLWMLSMLKFGRLGRIPCSFVIMSLNLYSSIPAKKGANGGLNLDLTWSFGSKLSSLGLPIPDGLSFVMHSIKYLIRIDQDSVEKVFMMSLRGSLLSRQNLLPRPNSC